jgi:hypothetical protein
MSVGIFCLRGDDHIDRCDDLGTTPTTWPIGLNMCGLTIALFSVW